MTKLPENILKRIERDLTEFAATEYNTEKLRLYSPQTNGMLQVACGRGYLAGAQVEAERAMGLVEALEKIEFDSGCEAHKTHDPCNASIAAKALRRYRADAATKEE